ncbi:hypothetical protein RN001_015215 [Aquatica leii]|uniref:Centromere/kinetochore protein zw10 homolog n=1 Tax=Aquatica leii TaxID=1421715 RepID=A0AAN7P326_9COLE|nr:hypothetical protein RN001_015215 [Aquatica leii]
MNFLSEVLKSVEETEMDHADKKIRELTKKLSSYKQEINTYIQDVYKMHCRYPSTKLKLLVDVTKLCEDIDNIKNFLETVVLVEIENQHIRVDSLKKELEQLKTETNLVNDLIQIHEKFLNVTHYQREKNYADATKELMEIDALLKQIPRNSVTESLHNTVTNEMVELDIQVCEELYEHFVMKEHKNGVLQENVLKIGKSSKFKDMLTILEKFGAASVELNRINKFCWVCICKPIMSTRTVVHVQETEDFNILKVSVKKTHSFRSYKEVFENLLRVFNFIQLHLNFEVDGDTIIGNNFKADFAQVLLKDCLGSTVPKTDSERAEYKQVIEDTKDFESKLVRLGFLKDKNPICEYVANMNNVPANMRCEKYAVEAISIMKKDLQNMVELGDSVNPTTEDQFPQCYVSISCMELLNLAHEMLQQALLESNSSATCLIATMQSFFYQYGSIVYAHHEDFLQNIPQQVVLFYNNCTYLAHELTQLNKRYNEQFSEEVLPMPPIFKDQPHQLRTIGANTFLGYIKKHIESMERTLVEYKFESERLSQVIGTDTVKSIKQRLHQYEILRTAWHKILPHSVYNKTLGRLLNCFCKRLIDTVVNASDILVTNTEVLIEMFRSVLSRGPKLFTNPEEVNLYVESWQKLNKMVFILGANLAQITEEWERGSLRTQFTPDEVKRFIKAVFPNTDCRAQALNHIVIKKIN